MSVYDQTPETMEPISFTDGTLEGVSFRPIKSYTDARGSLKELYREDELSAELHPAMAYVSETAPGMTRGPREHVDQTNYFVFFGPGEFTLYLWDTRIHSSTWGNRMKIVLGRSNQQSVVVPPGVVHAYKNTGDEPGLVFNAPNRLYAGEGKREPVDVFRHEDRNHSPYQLD